MATITISLPEEQARRLQELAQAAGTTPEEWLSQPQRDFAEAAAYVLQKKVELYRRLA